MKLKGGLSLNVQNNVKTMRQDIAKRAADELGEGEVINLGVGIPTLIPEYLGDKHVFLHSENGLLGTGPAPEAGQINPDLINASKQPVTELPGSAIFDSALSFAMIRGGHVDTAVIGALQVDQTGELANWAVPGKDILGVGGAMDLVAGVQKVILTMTHTSKSGEAKIVESLTYPSSGYRKADVLITEKAVFTFKNNQMYLVEVADGVTVEDIEETTAASFVVAL